MVSFNSWFQFVFHCRALSRLCDFWYPEGWFCSGGTGKCLDLPKDDKDESGQRQSDATVAADSSRCTFRWRMYFRENGRYPPQWLAHTCHYSQCSGPVECWQQFAQPSSFLSAMHWGWSYAHSGTCQWQETDEKGSVSPTIPDGDASSWGRRVSAASQARSGVQREGSCLLQTTILCELQRYWLEWLDYSPIWVPCQLLWGRLSQPCGEYQ